MAVRGKRSRSSTLYRRSRPSAANPAADVHGLGARVQYKDGELLIIDKPAGLACHAGPQTEDCLERYVEFLRLGALHPPHLVHRLDRDTSGCLLLARNARALKRLSRLFADGRVEKTYWAIVEGAPDVSEGVIDAPLRKISTSTAGWRMIVAKNGLSARTSFQVLATTGMQSLLQLSPQTGRTHQIRAHCAHMGWPILGDPVYGQTKTGAMLLHAYRLKVPKADGSWCIVTVEPPPLFSGGAQRLHLRPTPPSIGFDLRPEPDKAGP